MKIKNKNIGFYFFTFSLFLYSCSPTEPPNKGNINLQAEDVSCTEAWLKLELQNISLPVNITLLKNNNVGQIINLSKPDTTIYIDSLLPSKTYTFQAISQSSSLNQPSNKITLTTLDSTTHNFTWQTFTFGEEGAGSSYLSDVAIVETEDGTEEIWAVGAIYLKDSTGQPDPEPYAVAHWDGNSWKLIKLKSNCRLYYPNCGPDTLLIAAGHSIFARNVNDIWIAAGSVHHFDGKNLSEEAGILGAGNANAIWGNENELWFVGNNGFIAHRSSEGQWKKIESGTETFIGDIWGITDGYETAIYCVVSSFFVPGDKKILRIKNNKVDSVSWNMGSQLNGVWTNSEKYLYVCGGGVFQNKKGYWNEAALPSITTNAIRGNGLNDIFVAGDFGLVAHYNGVSWHIYKNIFDAGYSNIAVKGDITAIVGQRNGYGIITIGNRN